MNKTEVVLFLVLMLVLLPLEVGCGLLAYETIGEVSSRLLLMAVGLNLIPLSVALRSRIVASLLALALALIMIPYQVHLGYRLWRVQMEASRIVAYVYDTRIASGEYPSDLADYPFRDPDMARFVQAYRADPSNGGFYLTYRVGTPNTSHSYTPRHGWQYYPD